MVGRWVEKEAVAQRRGDALQAYSGSYSLPSLTDGDRERGRVVVMMVVVVEIVVALNIEKLVGFLGSGEQLCRVGLPLPTFLFHPCRTAWEPRDTYSTARQTAQPVTLTFITGGMHARAAGCTHSQFLLKLSKEFQFCLNVCSRIVNIKTKKKKPHPLTIFGSSVENIAEL